ncbi:Oidioi.mRNA.OKI2018_I69.PAR.g10298.t1.cds [Oikopleura dioica]|uniref:Oidioi.mRNA.OKI2018_I69.PAR.g10298.t1.cds n=1 Tax=Oikopleura dioica TaxID=34765 RepID=A0ABN7RUC2_OIKDI|nr:Oidioi.mRNA.OKI2018_I69.PAR.g10298.t1.cds [Oikopleura dioica]
MSEAGCEELEHKLETFVETVRQIGIIVHDFQPNSQTVLNRKLEEVVKGLKDIDQAKNKVNRNVPVEVLDYIDKGQNPSLYTKKCLDRALQSNEHIKGKLEVLGEFRTELAKQLSHVYPKTLEMLKGGFKIQGKKGAKIQKLQTNAFEKVESTKNDAVAIKDIDEKGLKIKEKEEDLVIPCIKVNRWKGGAGNKRKAGVDLGAENANKKQFKDEVMDEAAKAVLQDANRFLEVQEENKGDNLNIPLMAINRVPEGQEAETGTLRVDARADVSNLDDYDAVPIEKFGLGMLRGMGWKEQVGIGKNKQKIEEIRPTVRPKGLGLGAIPAAMKKAQIREDNKSQNNLEMRKGAFVEIIDGPYKGRYGKVTSLGTDGDLGRVTVQWALGKHGEPSEVLEGFTKVVSKKEYDDCGKDISLANKDKIEKKRKADERARKVEKLKEKAVKPEGVKWCHHGLIVKFVGNKDSKHYKKKYEVRKSVARDEIHARSLLTDRISEFDERDFETVIPKKTGSVMMVIAGSMKGEFGKIIDRDDKKETVHLELFNLRRDVERFKFDNVCEFNALAADFED